MTINPAKKIGIVCSKSPDLTAELVQDWIEDLGCESVKVCALDYSNEMICLKKEFDNVSISKNSYSLHNYHSLWFRRIDDFRFDFDLVKKYSQETSYVLKRTLENDKVILDRIFLKKLNGIWKVSSPNQVKVNKLDVLESATKLGINTPDYLITNNKSDLYTFFLSKENGIITKDIDFPFMTFENNQGVMIYVNAIEEEIFDALPDFFPVSFFQERIEKKFEIRSFILYDKIYSMAIFSQSDIQTKEDFRRYNNLKPNRRVPYKLPDNMERQLKSLMKELNLDSGSIDLLVDRSGVIHFLEVNPVGQFGMVSHPCNYYLEKEIAKKLCYE